MKKPFTEMCERLFILADFCDFDLAVFLAVAGVSLGYFDYDLSVGRNRISWLFISSHFDKWYLFTSVSTLATISRYISSSYS